MIPLEEEDESDAGLGARIVHCHAQGRAAVIEISFHLRAS
jgi:hypothetical protein